MGKEVSSVKKSNDSMKTNINNNNHKHSHSHSHHKSVGGVRHRASTTKTSSSSAAVISGRKSLEAGSTLRRRSPANVTTGGGSVNKFVCTRTSQDRFALQTQASSTLKSVQSIGIVRRPSSVTSLASQYSHSTGGRYTANVRISDTIRDAASGGSYNQYGRSLYDCAIIYLTCTHHHHAKMAMCKVEDKGLTFLPYCPIKTGESWTNAAINLIHRLLSIQTNNSGGGGGGIEPSTSTSRSASSAAAMRGKSSSSFPINLRLFTDPVVFDVLRIQVPTYFDYITRVSYHVRMTAEACKADYCKDNAMIGWINLSSLTDLPAAIPLTSHHHIYPTEYLGPEPCNYAIAITSGGGGVSGGGGSGSANGGIVSNNNNLPTMMMECREITILDVLLYQIHQHHSTTKEAELLTSVDYQEQDILRFYGDFLQHTYPSEYMTYHSLKTYLDRAELPYAPVDSHALFRAFAFNGNSYINFYEFLLGFAMWDKLIIGGGVVGPGGGGSSSTKDNNNNTGSGSGSGSGSASLTVAPSNTGNDNATTDGKEDSMKSHNKKSKHNKSPSDNSHNHRHNRHNRGSNGEIKGGKKRKSKSASSSRSSANVVGLTARSSPSSGSGSGEHGKHVDELVGNFLFRYYASKLNATHLTEAELSKFFTEFKIGDAEWQKLVRKGVIRGSGGTGTGGNSISGGGYSRATFHTILWYTIFGRSKHLPTSFCCSMFRVSTTTTAGSSSTSSTNIGLQSSSSTAVVGGGGGGPNANPATAPAAATPVPITSTITVLEHFRHRQCYPPLCLRQVTPTTSGDGRNSAIKAKIQRAKELCPNCRTKQYTLAVHLVKMSGEGLIYEPLINSNAHDIDRMQKLKRVQSERFFCRSFVCNQLVDIVRYFAVRTKVFTGIKHLLDFAGGSVNGGGGGGGGSVGVGGGVVTGIPSIGGAIGGGGGRGGGSDGSSGNIVPDWSNESVRMYTVDKILKILQEAKGHFASGARVLKITSPCYVIGDIHGNLHDLLVYEKVLWKLGPYLSACNFLFLGDYVDRGDYSVECILYLLCQKLLAPHRIFMLRGNHETRSLQKEFTFYNECLQKFGAKNGEILFEAFNDVFDVMPLCGVIDESIFCAHGGIPSCVQKLEQIMSIRSPLVDPDNDSDIALEILWNDPITNQEYDDLFRNNQEARNQSRMLPTGYLTNTKRGTGSYYSEEAMKRFMDTNQLTHIIRAHEVIPSGFQYHMSGKCITIFSCSHYCGGINEAAVAFVNDSKIRVIKVDTKD